MDATLATTDKRIIEVSSKGRNHAAILQVYKIMVDELLPKVKK
jgi:hypothetical protein